MLRVSANWRNNFLRYFKDNLEPKVAWLEARLELDDKDVCKLVKMHYTASTWFEYQQ
jgi:hypothetical protein